MSDKEPAESKWLNPMFIAIVAVCLSTAINVFIIYFNGICERKLERQKADAELILSMIHMDDADKIANNLQFLLDVKLIKDEDMYKNLKDYLKTLKEGEGHVLPQLSPGTWTKN